MLFSCLYLLKGFFKNIGRFANCTIFLKPNMLLLKQVFTHEINVQLIITHLLLKSLLVRNSPLYLWLCIFLGRKNLWKSILWKSCYGLFDLLGENDVTIFNTLLLTLICSNGTHPQASNALWKAFFFTKGSATHYQNDCIYIYLYIYIYIHTYIHIYIYIHSKQNVLCLEDQCP